MLNNKKIKKEIYKYFIRKDGNVKSILLHSSNFNIQQIIKSIYNHTISLPFNINFACRIYCILHNLKNIPICKNKMCRNSVKFISYKDGFRKFCSSHCANNDKDRVLKISLSQKGNNNNAKNPEVRLKISQTVKKNNISWNRGKKGIYSKETLKKMSDAKKGKKLSITQRIRKAETWKGGMTGKQHTIESRKKMRISRLNYISTNNNGISHPNFNQKACIFFDKLNKKFNLNGQHALNGGEYLIKELGYYLDFYDPTNKLIIEWDEEHHYTITGNLRKKDIQRQKEIQEYFPDFRFIRIREKDFIEKKQLLTFRKKLYQLGI